ncbi:DUF2812 domain-containing protein [Hathewaya massiliensis]|uniref:DUF2812 domain-containing protein n=1 Tax=Hathewaya massiliensis TaxID=1964382 RepID=UPI001157DD2C|nr:DUF2812 domain-containing protein [Hathewaya massiliensis]
MRVFKPFWSFKIKAIENWLKEKALQGYILKDVNPHLKIFTFEKSDALSLNYRISYENKGVTELQPYLIRNGWHKVCNKGRWFFLANEKPMEDIKATPSREPLLNRYKIASILLSIIPTYFTVITGIMLIFLLPMIIAYLFGIGDIKFINEVSLNRIPDIKTSHFTTKDLLDVGKSFFIISLFIYPIIKLGKNQKELKADLDPSYLELEEEFKPENLDKSKDNFNLIEKVGPTLLEPDKLEIWLENMESQGFNLEKVKRLGDNKFYFKKGTPRKIRYILDFQNDTKASYYEILKQDNWNLVYTGGGLPVKWSLWSKEYADERPNIYTEEEVISNAKKMLLTHSIFYIPMIGILGHGVIKIVLLLLTDISRTMEMLPAMVGLTLTILVPLIIFMYKYSKILRFYFRTKKRPI